MTPIDLLEIREQNDMGRRGREALRRDIADLCLVVGKMTEALDDARKWLERDGVYPEGTALEVVNAALSLVKRET